MRHKRRAAVEEAVPIRFYVGTPWPGAQQERQSLITSPGIFEALEDVVPQPPQPVKTSEKSTCVIMVGSLEEMDEDIPEKKEEKVFRPEIVCVHSESTGDTCSRCPPPEADREKAVKQVYLPPRTDPREAGSDRDPLSLDERGERVREPEEDGDVATKKNSSLAPDSDMTNKKKFIFHLDGLKENSGECVGGG